MRERKLEHLVGVLQEFIKAEKERELYVSFVELAQPQVEDWAFQASLSIEEEPDTRWLTDRLYTNPPGAVADNRFQRGELIILRDNLRNDGKKFAVPSFKKKSFLSKAKQWVLSKEFDRDFKKVFDHDARETKNLFSLCYLATLGEIDRIVRSDKVIGCQECGLVMVKEGKRTFCSESCRTRFNNKKRDPAKHNASEKQNRKQRIIKKNAQDRTKR